MTGVPEWLAIPRPEEIHHEPDYEPHVRPDGSCSCDVPHRAAPQQVVYTLHFDPPYEPYPGAPAYKTARHYTGTSESSRFLNVQLAAVNRELAELAAVNGTSHCPVQLRLRDRELAAVGLGVGPASLIAPRVEEDPAREHDEGVGWRVEVHIPAALIEDTGEGLRQLAGPSLVGFEIQDSPDPRLVRRGPLGPVPADLAYGQRQVLQVRSDAEAFRDEGALDHAGLLPGSACRAARACLVSGWRSGATVAAATDKPRPVAKPRVRDHCRRSAVPRVQESRILLAIAEDWTGMPTRIQESASDTPTRHSCHLTCDKRRPYPARARTNCRQGQQKTLEHRLQQRLAEHETGQGARLTQVQREAGGTWRLASVEPGGADRERQLKQHSAARRCPICQSETAERWRESTSPEPEPRVQPDVSWTPQPELHAQPEPQIHPELDAQSELHMQPELQPEPQIDLEFDAELEPG